MNQNADASHINQHSECSVLISAYVLPLYHDEEKRGNPDNTFYPGDGFHYLFAFEGTDTCLGFGPDTIESQGAFNLISHNILSYDSAQKSNHSHNDLNVIPKYLTTFHYYKITDTNTKCKTFAGGTRTCSTSYALSERPILSIREDQTMPFNQWKKVSKWRSQSLRDDIKIVETQSWGFTKIGSNHMHGDDEHLYEDQASIDFFEESVKNECTNIGKNKGCVFGHAEIDTDVVDTRCLLAELAKTNTAHNLKEDVCVDVTGSISLTVKGTKIVCDGMKCKPVTVKKSATIKPTILEPGMGIDLLKSPLPDTDGYDARNLDGTYYPHDPLSIVHQPKLKWKDQRSKTIQFETEKKHDLKKEFEYDCIDNLCDLFLESPGVKPHTIHLDNGDGITIYNATTTDLGNHTFDYTVKVYNMDREISSMSTSTDALVVKYSPKYTSYPYLRIADDKRQSFDNRQAAALHYFGSVGGGPDDTPGIHQGRRSKINGFHQAGFAYDPWHLVQINQTFAWSAASNSGIIPEVNTLDIDIVPANSKIIPIESNGDDAMFVRSGYGKVFFDYPLSSVIFDNKTGVPKYENVTSYVTLLSRGFAGKDAIYLTFWEFTTPEALFVTNLTVKTINQNGTITDRPIHVTAVPKLDKGAVYLTDYLHEKIIHDSNDSGLAQVIVDDTYPMIFDYYSNGFISENLRRISSQFQQFEDVTYETNSNTYGIFKLSENYLKESKKLRLEIPLEIGLTALSPTYIIISANGETKTIDAQFLDFGVDMEILINAEDDNVLEVRRGLGFLEIKHDKYFGGIEKISVNGKMIDVVCVVGCIIPVNDTSSLLITAWNEWGGTAHAKLPKHVIPEPDKISFDQINPVMGLLVLLPLVYVFYKKFNPK